MPSEKNPTDGENTRKEKSKLTEEQRLDWYVRSSIQRLSRYGINDLTNTEYLYLRQIAKESIVRQDFTEANREETYHKTGKISMDMFHGEEDIPIIFLDRMYGIRESEIPKKYIVKAVGAETTFIFNDKLESLSKKTELEQQGHQVLWQESAAAIDAFKALLKRKREAQEFEEETPFPTDK